MLGFLSRFVDSNDRELKRIQPFVDEANALEAEIVALSDEEIRARFAEIRAEVAPIAEPDEPDDDELHHPGPRAAARARQGAPEAGERPDPGRPRRGPARGLRDGPRGDAADPRDAPLRRPADRRRRPPPGKDRRDEDRRGQDPRPHARGGAQRAWPAGASTSSPSTTTSPGATRSGWARSSTSWA